MRAFAAEALRVLALQAPPEALLVLSAPAPLVPVETLLADSLPGSRLLWDPTGVGGAGGAWAFAGRGEAARLDASGPSRLDTLRTQGTALLASLHEQRDPACGELPSPRLFGGLAFRAGAEVPAPWTAFGDASFVLPRWLYGRSGTRAFLRLVLRAEEARSPERVLPEIDAVLAALERCAAPVAPAPITARLEEMSPDAWATLVDGALGQIRAGAFDKVVPARRTRLVSEEPLAIPSVLARMAALHPACVRFALQRGEAVFLGATPERLVARTGLQLETEALAGSIARRPEHDDADRAALLSSDKDRREHEHVVAGIRGALAPLCHAIDAAAVPTVRTLRNLHHLWTPIVAPLRHAAHVLDAVSALHPTPAVCGLPSAPAEAWLTTHEPVSRGWYAAPVGWFDAAGEGAFAVAIRSALVHAHEAWLYAGAGVVEGSVPSHEYAETAVKQRAMLTALGVES